MPPKKRRSKPGDVRHQGRVTVHRATPELPHIDEPTLPARAHQDTGRAAPPPSARYTPPIKSVRFRPGWHKAVGVAILVVGIAIMVLNDAMLLGTSATLLPGGHSELYLVLGLVVAGYSTWWCGWFDRAR